MSAKHSKKIETIRSLYIRDGRKCWWCSCELLPLDSIPVVTDGRLPRGYPTIDHLTPRTKGGHSKAANLVVSCQPCNNRRGDTVGAYHPRPLVEQEATTRCPDCTAGVWAESAAPRACPTCEGAGDLTATRAVELFLKQRAKARAKDRDRAEARTEVARLRALVEEVTGPGSARRDLAGLYQRTRDIVRQQEERILTLKVELAEATDGDLERMIPRKETRERALRLVSGEEVG